MLEPLSLFRPIPILLALLLVSAIPFRLRKRRKAYLITKIRLNIINFNRVCRIVVKLVLRSCTRNGGSHRAAARKSGRGALETTFTILGSIDRV
jgi:hypothetical protein